MARTKRKRAEGDKKGKHKQAKPTIVLDMSTMASKPGWRTEFYNKEVIVIEDSPTPPPPMKPVEDLHLPPFASTRSRKGKRGYNDTFASITIASPKKRKQPGTDATKPLDTPSGRPAPFLPCPDDKDGYYIIKPNCLLTKRYMMLRLLGQGTYGKVVECYDRVRHTHCAIKIIRSIQKYRDASNVEIRVLNALKQHDPLNLNKCIHLREWFEHENHVCMVFELLGKSIFDFLKQNHFKPFPLAHIQQFAKQLLSSIAFVHSLKLIHTDLKPENILLVNHETVAHPSKRASDSPFLTLKQTDIRLIDFGAATFEKDHHSPVVSTRHYRAPEIILGTGWSYPCDIWSIGCILVELFTGDALFQTHDDLEHLAMMNVVLGKFPPSLIHQSIARGQSYFKDNKLRYPIDKTTPQSQKYVKSLRLLTSLIAISSPPTSTQLLFLDLLVKMLAYEPGDRISAREALKHPFFHLKL
ncbi:kinase-like protein [Hesseltinella vesiculosa]|uniref:Kinase-like protein n=1 Tax=Hesseltinella vesiculosa TaxID=101127 RepID=A0A1X2GQ94_9FUNG|nr:kinase-like protein [Hesseltinella vesiculosa]